MRRDTCTPSPKAHFHGADYGNIAGLHGAAVKDVELDLDLDKDNREQGNDNDGS